MNAPSPSLTPAAQAVAALLAPVDGPDPVGANLEYSAAYLGLVRAAQARPEQQYGDTIIAAQPADWREVARSAEQLLASSKDLRIAGFLVQAWARQQGMPGYARGLVLVAGLLERYWDSLHPALVDDGDTDPYPRCNAIAVLFDGQALLRELRAAPLLGPGTPTLRELEALLDNSPPEGLDYLGGRERLLLELARAREAGHPGLLAIDEAAAAVRSIVATLDDKLGQEWVPEVQQVEKLLQRFAQAAAPAAPPPASADQADAGEPPVRAGGPDAPADWRTAPVQSRADANLLLEKICVYLEQHEPSHPAPLLLRRVQRLMQLTFYDIMRDLAPDSLSRIDLLIGRTDTE